MDDAPADRLRQINITWCNGAREITRVWFDHEARSQMDAAEALTPAGEPAGGGRHPGRTQRASEARRASESTGLTERERTMLAFEGQWWKYAGAKEQAIRELFDMSATRYYQVLNSLLDKQEAMAADPMLIKRLRRQRSIRLRSRAARRLGFDPS
jgi:hypothetical protein